MLLAALFSLSIMATPADARPAPPSSTTTMTFNGCQITVRYQWSGFSGRDLTATFGVYDATGTQFDVSIVLANVEGQSGRSGDLSRTFDFNGTAVASQLSAHGSLSKISRKNVVTEIAGSHSRTGEFNNSCGNPT